MIAQSVADILSHHVKLAVEGIDRMYLNCYVPALQYESGVVTFFCRHRGQAGVVAEPVPGDRLELVDEQAGETRPVPLELRLALQQDGVLGSRVPGRADGRVGSRGRAIIYLPYPDVLG